MISIDKAKDRARIKKKLKNLINLGKCQFGEAVPHPANPLELPKFFFFILRDNDETMVGYAFEFDLFAYSNDPDELKAREQVVQRLCSKVKQHIALLILTDNLDALYQNAYLDFMTTEPEHATMRALMMSRTEQLKKSLNSYFCKEIERDPILAAQKNDQSEMAKRDREDKIRSLRIRIAHILQMLDAYKVNLKKNWHVIIENETK